VFATAPIYPERAEIGKYPPIRFLIEKEDYTFQINKKPSI